MLNKKCQVCYVRRSARFKISIPRRRLCRKVQKSGSGDERSEDIVLSATYEDEIPRLCLGMTVATQPLEGEDVSISVDVIIQLVSKEMWL